MELRHLQYFVAIAEELHFGRAADRLHIVQPALSKQIIALERELECELLDRAHGVSLTPAGEVFYEEAQSIVQQAERAAEGARATARGELGGLDIGFIGSAMWSVVPEILRAHRRAHPQLTFRLHQFSNRDQMEQIGDGLLDVGFVRPMPFDEALIFEPIWREQLVVGLADDHPLATCEVIDLAALKDESFVVLPRRLSRSIHDLLITVCLSYGFSPRTLEEGNSPAALQMVVMGLGVVLVPESVQDAGVKGLACRPLIRPTPETELALCYRRGNNSAALRAFLETARRVVPTVTAHGRPVSPAEEQQLTTPGTDLRPSSVSSR